MTTQITGASDDLIEVYGDVDEEFDAWDSKGFNGYVVCSDGTVLHAQYGEGGIWRFNPLVKGTLFEKVVQGSVEEDTFDVAHFKDGLKWVAISRKDAFAKSRK